MKYMDNTKDYATRRNIVFSSIDDALERIDFAAISRAMEVLGWSYADGIPTAETLKEIQDDADIIERSSDELCL